MVWELRRHKSFLDRHRPKCRSFSFKPQPSQNLISCSITQLTLPLHFQFLELVYQFLAMDEIRDSKFAIHEAAREGKSKMNQASSMSFAK